MKIASQPRRVIISIACIFIVGSIIARYVQFKPTVHSESITTINDNNKSTDRLNRDQSVNLSAAENNPTEKYSRNIAIQYYQDYLLSPPSYMEGTDIRGLLTTSFLGELIVTKDIKNQFDYFYLMSEDKTLEDIKHIIAGHLYKTLDEPALSSALELLTSYNQYLLNYEAFTSNIAATNTSLSPSELAKKISQLRKKSLGDDISAIFFSTEELLQQETLNNLKIKSQESSNDDNFISLLTNNQETLETSHNAYVDEEMKNNLNQHINENQIKTLSYVSSTNKIKSTLENSDNKKTIHDLRKELYGDEAAERLNTLDKKREKWDSAVKDYSKIKAELEATGGLSASDQQQEINHQLKTRYLLSDSDLKRLHNLHYN